MFVFGTQYLRGATPEKDQWDRDMETMCKMGFNTIRAWLVWNAVEKEEGKIDYEYIHQFLTTAKKHNLQVGLLFHMHACPAWAVKKYSKYFYVSEDQLPFEPAVRANTPSGGWPGLCYDHAEVRDMEERFIRNVIQETRKYDNVAFYEPMNEPHQWIDFQKNPSGIYCYCDASVKKFREWLKRKYHDIHELNRAWGYFYSSFDEVRPPRWTSSYSDYCDFRLFNMDNVRDEIAFRANIIRDADVKPVLAHSWNVGVTCEQLGAMAFDDWKNAEVFDKWGFSAFPNSLNSCAALGLGGDSARCSARGKEYWQSELGSGVLGTGLFQKGRIDDQTFNNFSLESLRHGARGLLYWQFRKERFGAEIGGFSMTDNAGNMNNLSENASRLCKAIQENEDMFKKNTVAKAQVALVFSIRSYLANWCSNNKKDNSFAVNSMLGYYRMLWEENIATDLLHEDIFDNLSQYKMIILPSPYAISPQMAEALKGYVKNGGTLVSDPYFGAFDEHFQLSRKIPGFGFDEVFGCTEDDFSMADQLVLHNRERKISLKNNIHRETFKNVKGTALLSYENDTPAVVMNRWGQGKAVISGVNLGYSYANSSKIEEYKYDGTENVQNHDAYAKPILMYLLDQAGVQKNLCTVSGVQFSFFNSGKDHDADGFILINNESVPKKGEIPLHYAYQQTKVIYGHIKCRVKEKVLEFELDPNESAVIRLQP